MLEADARRDGVREGASALDHLHRQVRPVALDAEAVDPDDVRVAEPCQRRCPTSEAARQRIGAAREHLQRGLEPEGPLERTIHRAHPAGAQTVDNDILAEAAAKDGVCRAATRLPTGRVACRHAVIASPRAGGGRTSVARRAGRVAPETDTFHVMPLHGRLLSEEPIMSASPGNPNGWQAVARPTGTRRCVTGARDVLER